jgi:branched-subunit amino acid aminotransferase/4-amino-4-deoxychorismate lyase
LFLRFVKKIKKFNEAFITSTSRGILPIKKIDNTNIPTSKGKITKIIKEEFQKIRENFRKNENFV